MKVKRRKQRYRNMNETTQKKVIKQKHFFFSLRYTALNYMSRCLEIVTATHDAGLWRFERRGMKMRVVQLSPGSITAKNKAWKRWGNENQCEKDKKSFHTTASKQIVTMLITVSSKWEQLRGYVEESEEIWKGSEITPRLPVLAIRLPSQAL